MNLHKSIREEYGQECVKIVRDYESLARKEARFRNHLRFNLHCKHKDVIPTSLRLRSTVPGLEANKIIKRAERSLLGVRIGQTVQKLKRLDRQKSELKVDIVKRLPGKQQEIEKFVSNVQEREHQEVKSRQQNKFQRLVSKNVDKIKDTHRWNNNLANECISRWVKNCSDRILSDPELSVLRKGLNFAVTPRKPPVIDIVTATESACRSLNASDANELRAKVVSILSNNTQVKEQNVTKDEWKAIEDLRKDDTITVLPADKGRVTVIMKKEEYKEKCRLLLEDSKTYQKLPSDPTARYKKQFISALKDLKDRKVIPPALHKRLYPTTDQPPRFYGLPKVHKQNMPLRPIVSSIGTISYQCARYLADILSPLVGKTRHHVKNSKAFAEEVKDLRVGPDEEMRSYDVSALFTSVPVDKALIVIRQKLEEDTSLSERTPLAPEDITNLLELCLKCTYFQYEGEFYLQIHGAAMGSPVSPIVCNLYMEDFEQRALATAEHPPDWWKRYVDDTHTILKKEHSQAFTDHINSIDDDIKWTTEGEVESMAGEGSEEKERILAFLDTVTVLKGDGKIQTRVYRKETHTDQYLNFESHHPLEHKKGVVRTLLHRAESIVSDPKDLEKEKEHIREALRMNQYPDWVLYDTPTRQEEVVEVEEPEVVEEKDKTRTVELKDTKREKKRPVVIPYVKGVSESIRRVFKGYEIPMYFKPANTLRQLLVRPKDKVEKDKIVGPVYHIACSECDASYIGETERSLKARFQEHRRPSSTTSEVSRHIHVDQPEHSVDMDKTRILAVEPRWFERGVKEAIYIRLNNPTLNKDGGRYNLPPVWNNLLKSQTKGGPRSEDLSQ